MAITERGQGVINILLDRINEYLYYICYTNWKTTKAVLEIRSLTCCANHIAQFP